MKKSVLSLALAGGLIIGGTGGLHQAKADSPVNPADLAKQGIGEAYSWGNNDCSGFTMKVFAKLGVTLPHNAAAQAGYGTYVSKQDLQPGDLVFFHTYGTGITHVGIYVGNDQMISSETAQTGVRQTQIFGGGASSYWAPRYVTARRIIGTAPQVQAAKLLPSKTTTQTVDKSSTRFESKTIQPKATTGVNQETQKAVGSTAPAEPNTSAVQTKPIKTGHAVYIVQAGDTLWAISRDNGITVSQIQKFNQLSNSTIFPGQNLKLQAPSKDYSIEKGDTLWVIARENGITVSQLMKTNHLSSELIFPGDKLTIPQN